MTAFCLKCHRETEVKQPSEVILKNGNRATRGLCSCCGARVCKVGRK